MWLCPWSLASSIPVLGLERVCPRKGCPWPRIFFVSLASSLVSSTPPLQFNIHCNCLNFSDDLFFFFGGHQNLDRKTVSILEQTFFLEVTLIWAEKPISFRAKFNVIFRAKVWGPLKSFWAPTPTSRLLNKTTRKS